MRGETGFEEGFDVYEDRIAPRRDVALGGVARPGGETLAAIEPWLREVSGGPFFLFFHLFEPHMPYDPPDPERWADLYDGEVAAADAVVGRLLDLLRKLGAYDRSVIVLLSDHGEGLGDHGEQEHGIFLYREALQVPLLLKLPNGERAGARVPTPVQLIDVLPTVLELVGAARRPDLPGSSLLAPSLASRKIYAETYYPRLHYGWSELTSVIDGQLHLIHGPDPELYDLEQDPAQKRNVLRENRRAFADLRAHLETLERELEPPAAVDPETREKLEALGYLGSAVAQTSGTLPDPKAQLPSLQDLRRATELLSSGDPGAALPLYRKVLQANPGMLDGWMTLGEVLGRLGRLAESAEAYARAFEISGGDPDLGRRTAEAYGRLGLFHLERRSWREARQALQACGRPGTGVG